MQVWSHVSGNVPGQGLVPLQHEKLYIKKRFILNPAAESTVRPSQRLKRLRPFDLMALYLSK